SPTSPPFTTRPSSRTTSSSFPAVASRPPAPATGVPTCALPIWPPTTTTFSTTSSTTTTTTTLPCQCHDVCTPGPAECATGCDPCVALVCAQDPTCCDPTLSWTDLCVSKAQNICCPNSNLSCCLPG